VIERGRRTRASAVTRQSAPKRRAEASTWARRRRASSSGSTRMVAELPRTAPWAAGGLTALLVGLFPANVCAALNGIATSPEDALVPRTLMQVVFLAATVAVLASSVRGRRLRWRSTVAPASAQG
jgi:hypothetical protein